MAALARGLMVVLLALLVAPWCRGADGPMVAPSGQGRAQVAGDKLRLQLAGPHKFRFAGYYAALAQGYYREAGLDVELLPARPGRTSVDGVLAGEAEFGIQGADLLLERVRGKPVVALAAIFQHSPKVLLARRDVGIDTVHDLGERGPLLGRDAAELLAYLRSENVPVRIGMEPQGHDLAAFIAGREVVAPADATDATYLLDKAGVPFNEFSPRSAGIDFYGDTLFTRQSVLDEDADRVKRFLEASLRGWHYALSHRSEVTALILERYAPEADRAQLIHEAERVRRLMNPDAVEVGHMHPGRWRHIADTYAELGMIPAGFNLDGFLYDEHTRPDYSRHYWGIGLALLLAVLAALVGAYYRRLNQALYREIAERKVVESQLKESEARYRNLVEMAPFPALISRGDDGRILFVNQRAEEHFGVQRADILSRNILDFYETTEDRVKLLGQLLREDHVTDLELRLRDQHGIPFWAYVSAATIEYDGQPAIFVALNDITARKRTEMALKESEARFRALIDSSPDGVIITGPWGNISFVSPRVLEIFGFERPEQMLGREITDFVLPSDQAVARHHAGELLKGRKKGAWQVRLARTDGGVRWIESDGEVLLDPEGRISGMFFISRDITERKRMEAELERLANIDGLTGLANRRHFMELLEKEAERRLRYGNDLAVLAIDIDHFKRINDSYGHATGDEALRRFSAVLSGCLRRNDFAGRMGGEEFMVALPETRREEALVVAERIRAAVAKSPLLMEGYSIQLTVSVGVANQAGDAALSELLRIADQALYTAKESGRNRVICHSA